MNVNALSQSLGAVLTFLLAFNGCMLVSPESDDRDSTGSSRETAPLEHAPEAAGEKIRDELTEQFRGTAGIIDRPSPIERPVTLSEVQPVSREHFDRVVLTFDGETLPGYHIEYIDKPVRQCGSGNVVPLAGQGWLSVRMSPAQAHNAQGQMTVSARALKPDCSLLKEMAMTCNFEGQVEWVLGLAAPNRYRVIELEDPARLVIDIRH